MKKLPLLWMLLLLLLTGACKKYPPPSQPPKEISTIITDAGGKPLGDAHAGTIIQLTAEAFRKWNQEGRIKAEGKLYFDTIPAQIIEARDNYILTILPLMGYIDTVRIDVIGLTIGSSIFQLCRSCLLYRPTVRGVVFAGFTGGKADGTFTMPAEMTADGTGNLYVIDQRPSHDVIIKVTPAGVTSVFAGGANEFGRLVGIGINHTTGLMYVSDATAKQVKTINMATPSLVSVLAGSGATGNTDGTGAAASFAFGAQRVDDFASSELGQGLAVDAAGNIFVGENYNAVTFGSQLRKITPAGVVTTVPGSRITPMAQEQVALPSGVTINTSNELFYVSGSSGFFQGITKISPGGVASRLAGKTSFEGLNDGTGAVAQFSYPKAIAAFNDFYYVADGTNGALRKVSTSGKVITLAGVGHFSTATYCGCPFVGPRDSSYHLPLIVLDPDGHEELAKAIRMDQVGGLAVIHGGLIYVADYGYKCIWKITIG
ncbi:hypothetical protein [uncultured Chitinophaga sp.]|jgi:NHL repeat.|uniref:hypothetical protein n=1 Tax=uncultured Chitinophaga sp. TaxID=339340 RepID=UPI00262C3A5C|nr:hypothetical protein [uncultured Chitinophaga sp.]